MELVDLINTLYQKIGWNDKQKKEFQLAYGQNTYHNYFKKVLPGS